MKHIFKAKFCDIKLRVYVLAFLFLAGCSGTNDIGTGVANPPSSNQTAASAAASVFGGSGSESSSENVVQTIPKQLLDLFIQQAIAQSEQEGSQECDNDPQCTCTFLLTGEDDIDNENIAQNTYGTPGTYGSFNNSITIEADDFCTETDGTTENADMGPDGKGRFATYVLLDDVPGDCDGTTVTMKASSSSDASLLSSGIWRGTVADTTATDSLDQVDHQPEIYGSFIMEIDGEEAYVECTIFLGTDEEVIFADCSDIDGNEIVQETDLSCSFNSES